MTGSQVASRTPSRLLVLTHTPHWVGIGGEWMAYEPYVREIRVWASIFRSVTICHPVGEGVRRNDLASYGLENIRSVPLRYSLSTGPRAALSRLLRLPAVMACALREIRAADLTLLRSPSHFALVGTAAVRLLRTPSITKWAGENGAFPGERLPSRLERLFQSVPSALHPVLVYGPPRRSHQFSFLPALMTHEELVRARQMSAQKAWGPPWRVLSVGKLLPVKGFDLALEGLAEFRRARPGVAWTFSLVGEGPARADLERLVQRLELRDRVEFLGALPFSEVQRQYAVAHMVIMPGVKEGWPKVIAEAWAHGAVPLAAAAGLVPWILRVRGTGIAFDPSPNGLADALGSALAEPERLRLMAAELHVQAEHMSLEQFRIDLERVLARELGFRGFPLSSAVAAGS